MMMITHSSEHNHCTKTHLRGAFFFGARFFGFFFSSVVDSAALFFLGAGEAYSSKTSDISSLSSLSFGSDFPQPKDNGG